MSFWKPGSSDIVNNDAIYDQKHETQSTENCSLPNSSPNKLTLSKGIMTMKFMKRKTEADQAAVDEAAKRRKLLTTEWSSELNDNSSEIDGNNLIRTTFVKDEVDLLSALPGRRSFGGYNKAMERHYEQIMDEKRFDKATERANKMSVSDSEMVERYQDLIGLPRGPNQGKAAKHVMSKNNSGSNNHKNNNSRSNNTDDGNRRTGDNNHKASINKKRNK